MRVRGNNLRDLRLHPVKVPCKRPSHLGRAGVDCDSIVKHRREQFPKQQRYGVGQQAIQKEDGQLAAQQIDPLVVCSGENIRSLRRRPDSRPKDKRQTDEEAQCIARPERS